MDEEQEKKLLYFWFVKKRGNEVYTKIIEKYNIPTLQTIIKDKASIIYFDGCRWYNRLVY